MSKPRETLHPGRDANQGREPEPTKAAKKKPKSDADETSAPSEE